MAFEIRQRKHEKYMLAVMSNQSSWTLMWEASLLQAPTTSVVVN